MITGSVVSYPDRGPWGKASFRGNTSGWLVRDLIEFYQPKSVLDPCEGSGTTRDVCRELGVEYDGFDLQSGFDILTSPLPCRKYDMIFFHPPYWDIIKYSNDPRDLSNCRTFDEYIQKLLAAIRRLGEYLTEDGVLVVLIGDVRKRGEYYPLGAYIQVLHRAELKDKLVKIQHNVQSNSKRYGGRFVRIMHEEVLVLSGFRPITWAELVIRALKEIGGAGTLAEIYSAIQNHPKILTNPTWQATVRRTLQENAAPVRRGTWRLEDFLQ